MRRQHGPQSGPPRPYPLTTYAPIAPAPSGVSGRSFSYGDPNYPPGRTLIARPSVRTTASPNPSVTNGESPSMLRSAPIEQELSDPPPKRGRPSKAAVEERDRKLAAEGKTYVPKKRPVKRQRSSLAPGETEPKEEESSTPLLQTPSARAPELPRESSSGKRRRRTKELSPLISMSAGAEVRQQDVEPEGESNVAESPSDRLFPGHRDRGSAGSSLSRPTPRGSEPFEPSHTISEFA